MARTITDRPVTLPAFVCGESFDNYNDLVGNQRWLMSAGKTLINLYGVMWTGGRSLRRGILGNSGDNYTELSTQSRAFPFELPGGIDNWELVVQLRCKNVVGEVQNIEFALVDPDAPTNVQELYHAYGSGAPAGAANEDIGGAMHSTLKEGILDATMKPALVTHSKSLLLRITNNRINPVTVTGAGSWWDGVLSVCLRGYTPC